VGTASLYYSAAYSAAAGAWSTAAIAGAAAGAVAGGVVGGWRGATAGALTGGLLGGIGGYYGNTWTATRVVAEGAVGGIGSELQGRSFADGFKLAGGFSLLRWGAYEMRQAMVTQSCRPPGNQMNRSGISAGAFEDQIKLGGGRFPSWLSRTLGWDQPGIRPSLLGGNQSGPGSFFRWPYSPGGFFDRLVESYAGPHDWMSSFRYAANGDLLRLSPFGTAMYGAYSALAIVPATPFAFATAFPSQLAVPVLVSGHD